MEAISWLRDRFTPIGIVAVSFGLGALWWWLGASVISTLVPTSTILTTSTPPSTVTGADLVADLLTISALTASVCIAYICLPRDRVEVKLATITKVHLAQQLIEIKHFSEFVEQTDPALRSHSCNFIQGLLKPRDGLGGWYDLSDADMQRSLGVPLWKKLKKFVNEHLDEQWIRVLIYGLCLVMALGFVDLGLRFIGFFSLHYSGFEVGTIISLLAMNIGTGATLLALATGTHSGEKDTISAISVAAEEVKKNIKIYQSHKLQANIDKITTVVEASKN